VALSLVEVDAALVAVASEAVALAAVSVAVARVAVVPAQGSKREEGRVKREEAMSKWERTIKMSCHCLWPLRAANFVSEPKGGISAPVLEISRRFALSK